MAEVLSFVNGVGMTPVSSEDNECAQALLALAMSSICLPPPAYNTGSPGMVTSHLKRQLTPEEEEREEIVKRIKLDHCYYWVQGSSISCQTDSDSNVPLGQNSAVPDTDDVDISFQKYPPGIKSGKENALDMVAKWRMDNVKREKKVALKSNVLHTKSQNRFGDPYVFEDEATASSMSSLGEDEDSNQSAVNSGLDLLLKCLSDNQPTYQNRSGAESLASHDEDYQEDSETESEDETGYRRQPDVEYEHKCRHCLKTFSKKRYLTKHVRRMHPDGMITSPEEVSTACPNCLKIVSKRNFQRHLMSCQYDSVACPLCGVQIRREHMVRHKEKMHNAQRNLEMENGGADYGLHQLADLVFLHSQGKKIGAESKPHTKDNHKEGTAKKNAAKKKSPANNKKTKDVKAAVKRKVANRKTQKADGPNARQAFKTKSPKSSTMEIASFEGAGSLFDTSDEMKGLSLRNVLMGNDTKGLVPVPSTSKISGTAPMTHLSPRSEQVKLTSPSGSRVMKAENSVKSKVILQPTRIKNMVSVSV